MNTNVKVIGLTRLGIKPESTAQETDAPYHSAIRAVFECLIRLKTKFDQRYVSVSHSALITGFLRHRLLKL